MPVLAEEDLGAALQPGMGSQALAFFQPGPAAHAEHHHAVDARPLQQPLSGQGLDQALTTPGHVPGSGVHRPGDLPGPLLVGGCQLSEVHRLRVVLEGFDQAPEGNPAQGQAGARQLGHRPEQPAALGRFEFEKSLDS